MPTLSSEQQQLANDIYCGSNPIRSSVRSIGVQKTKEFVESTVDYYVNYRLRGSKLRARLIADYGIGIIFWIQLAIAVYQIAKLIQEWLDNRK